MRSCSFDLGLLSASMVFSIEGIMDARKVESPEKFLRLSCGVGVNKSQNPLCTFKLILSCSPTGEMSVSTNSNSLSDMMINMSTQTSIKPCSDPIAEGNEDN